MRTLGWCGVGLLGAVATGACGSSEKSAPAGQSGAAGSAPAAGTGQVGGSAGSGGAGTNAGNAGSAGQSGNPTGGSNGIGSGELDASCRERTTNHVAGSEIGLREGVSAEGDRFFLGYYDKKSGKDCSFLEDATGVMRCFPPADTDSRFYLDADCEQGVEYRGICAGDHVAVPVSEDSCDSRRRVFAYGPSKAEALVWERDASGACRQYGPLNHLYERGPELVPSDYPAVEKVTWRGLGRIARFGYQGAGGLQIVRSFQDEELGEGCSANTLGDGKRHCAPYALGSFQLTDESCTKTLLSTAAGVCGAPPAKFGAALTSASCVGDTYVEHGEPFTGELYLRSGCEPASAAASEGAQVSTPKVVPPERFATITEVVNESDAGRLKPVYNTTADGGCWFQGWFDSEQQTACEFQQTSDQKYRCVPPPPSPPNHTVIELFTDAGCSAPVVYFAASCAEQSVPKLVSLVTTQTCQASPVEVRPVLAALPTPRPALWWKQSGTCESYTYGVSSTFYELGAPLPPETFVSAELAPE